MFLAQIRLFERATCFLMAQNWLFLKDNKRKRHPDLSAF